MLSKLLKYEMKATARIFLPLFAVVLLSATINRLITILSPKGWESPAIISMVLYVTILVGMFVVTAVMIIQRFYKNLLSEEGYLMFTLPVKPWMHIVSKLLWAMIWTLTSVAVAIGSVLIIASAQIFTPETVRQIGRFFSQVYSYEGAWLFTAEFALLVLVAGIAKVIMIYASIAVGHLVNNHKILASLGAYLGLSTISQLLFTVMGLLPGMAGIKDRYTGGILSDPNGMVRFDGAGNLAAILPAVQGFLWYSILFSAFLSVGYFVITNLILGKKLNLE
jgi:hypothetical protein